MKGKVFFVSGIDTGVGKTFATGILARALMNRGKKVITQKMVQTGCKEVSEDIEMHRRLMGIPFTDDDRAGLTCPYVFTYPCSPHMAAERDGRSIDLAEVTRATRALQERYEYVLLEGAGGLMVPNDHHSLAIDYISEMGYPLILVTSGKLGSINHTLLSLLACRHYGIRVDSLVYNTYPRTDALIEENTLTYLRELLASRLQGTNLIVLPEEGSGSPAGDVLIPRSL